MISTMKAMEKSKTTDIIKIYFLYFFFIYISNNLDFKWCVQLNRHLSSFLIVCNKFLNKSKEIQYIINLNK